MSTENEKFARRYHLRLLVPAEKAIHDAIVQVKCLEGHPLNREADILLNKALNKVSDYVDQLVIECQPPTDPENQTTPGNE